MKGIHRMIGTAVMVTGLGLLIQDVAFSDTGTGDKQTTATTVPRAHRPAKPLDIKQLKGPREVPMSEPASQPPLKRSQ